METELGISAILARRKEISAEMERLRVEDGDLEIAIRIFNRYASSKAAEMNGAGQSTSLGPPRPEGIPPLFNMTETVIRDAVAGGKSGLRGQEIVYEIGKKFWPGVQGRQILPPIYAFAKKGRLHKTKDGVFKPIDK